MAPAEAEPTPVAPADVVAEPVADPVFVNVIPAPTPVTDPVPVDPTAPTSDAALDVWKEDRVKPPVVPDVGDPLPVGGFVPATVQVADKPFVVVPTPVEWPVVAAFPVEERAPREPVPTSSEAADAGLNVWINDRKFPPLAPTQVGVEQYGTSIPFNPGVALDSIEARVPHGTIIERTERGWKVSLMYGGAVRLFGEGPTIFDAFSAVGL